MICSAQTTLMDTPLNDDCYHNHNNYHHRHCCCYYYYMPHKVGYLED